MAQQQQQPKADRAFTNVVIPSKVNWKKGMTVHCVATVTNPRSAEESVDGQEVNAFVGAAKIGPFYVLDGKMGCDLPVPGPGTWPIELQMFDTSGKKVVHQHRLVAEEEHHEEKHQLLRLDVFTRPQRGTGIVVTVNVIDEDNHPVTNKDVQVTVHYDHPDSPKSFKTHGGSGSAIIPFPEEDDTCITVQGHGQSHPLWVNRA